MPKAAEREVHTLRVRVFDPSGREVKLYADRIETRDGAARGEVYLALNDPVGTWRLVVTDVASGVSAEGRFAVVK